MVTLFGDTLTGEADPVFVAIMAVLAVGGVAGLLLDTRLPTRSERVGVKPQG